MTGSPKQETAAPATELPPEILLLPSEQGASIIGRRLLAAVADQRLRLDDENDEAALHDFRVALRQLRSWLRAFRPELDQLVRGKLNRRLSRMADASNESRDGEVQLEWLREQARTLPRDARQGCEWLIDRIEARRVSADDCFRKRVVADFERTRSALDTELAAIHDDDGASPRIAARSTLAAAVAAVVHTQAERLRAHLGAVHGLGDDKEVHRARLAGKRLRYLLHPLSDLVEDENRVLPRLKPMQDALGELRDAHTMIATVAGELSALFSERAEQIVSAVRTVGSGTERFLDTSTPSVERGLLVIAARLHERAVRAFGEVRDSWLGARAEVLVAELMTVADQLDAIAVRGSDIEIERKFLLSGLPTEARGIDAVEIEQGYLPGDRLTERLRHLRDGESERWVRTVKVGSGVARTEVEEPTTRELFIAMWPLTEGRRVRKRRYAVADGPLTWQIDEFLDRNLVLAEVELPSATVVVEPPTWLAPVVVREVTNEPDFANATLAR